MDSTFRKSMSWLHTWAGLIMCALLFAIFWMGTLSVFDREIDRWMMPMTRLAAPSEPLSIDATVLPILQKQAPRSTRWTVTLPTERVPALRLTWQDKKNGNISRYLDPVSGRILPEAGTHAGTGFIFPFHFRLNLRFMDIGLWLVGIVTMGMLVAIVSGVVIHKKIFREFFTFRPRSKTTQRAALDLHNLSGVLGLPFHFLIGLSGLIIMFAVYFPTGWQAAYDGDRQALNEEASSAFKRGRAKSPDTLASLDAMTAKATRLWGDGQPAQVRVYHPGDANSYVEVRRYSDDRVARDNRTIYFDGASGAVLARGGHKPVKHVQEFISGLHEIQFKHWTLRWLYFVAGLGGCVMIATGFLIWIESRKVQHARKGLIGARLVEALAIGSVPGIILATFAFFIVNRLLPLDATLVNTGRAALEMWTFYLIWILCFAHAGWRGRAAWAEQSFAVALCAVTAAVLNWITTGDHLLRSMNNGMYAVAGMDTLLLVGAGLAWVSARKLRRRRLAPMAVSRRGGIATAESRRNAA